MILSARNSCPWTEWQYRQLPGTLMVVCFRIVYNVARGFAVQAIGRAQTRGFDVDEDMSSIGDEVESAVVGATVMDSFECTAD